MNDNGGIIGPPNVPSRGAASGVWLLEEQFLASVADIWPVINNRAGYVAGGKTSVNVDTVDKFAFADDSRTTLATGLSSARQQAAGFASDVAGYAAGGLAGPVDTVDKFAFTDDSRTTLATGLSSARSGTAGFAE